MDDDRRPGPATRRAFLAGAAVVLAGCGAGPDGTSQTGTSTPTGTATSSSAAAETPTATDTATATETETATETPDEDTPEETPAEPAFPDRVALERVAGGFTAPLDFAVPPGDDRPWVVDQAGQAFRLDPGGPTGVLDLTDRMVEVGGGYTEQGFLGLAFHPGFAVNGRLFCRYSAPPREGTPDGYSHTFVLSEFRATGARGTVDPASERTLLELPEPQFNHNAGPIAFGPDGLLYVATGDGGGGGDRGTGHVADWYDANPGGNGQDVTENLLGSVLRIDVDGREDGKPYAIPSDNPLVGREGLDEQYAWGFRNPWRLAFDGGRLFVADVGQRTFEEVNVVEAGANHGWNVREGFHCYGTGDCPDATPGSVRGGEPLVDPVVEYPHRSGGERVGAAVVGGQVYRGDAVPSLRGAYLFGDYSGSLRGDDATLFTTTPPAVAAEGARSDDGPLAGDWVNRSVAVEGLPRRRNLLAVGRDRAGEVYVCTTRRSNVTGETGVVYRLIAA